MKKTVLRALSFPREIRIHSLPNALRGYAYFGYLRNKEQLHFWQMVNKAGSRNDFAGLHALSPNPKRVQQRKFSAKQISLSP